MLLILALPQFAHRAEKIVTDVFDAEQSNTERDTSQDVNEMIEACSVIHDAVNDVRRALLMNRNPEDVDSDNEYEEGKILKLQNYSLLIFITKVLFFYYLDGVPVVSGGGTDTRSITSDADIENQQKVMRHLPEESKREIQKQIDVFKVKSFLLFYFIFIIFLGYTKKI